MRREDEDGLSKVRALCFLRGSDLLSLLPDLILSISASALLLASMPDASQHPSFHRQHHNFIHSFARTDGLSPPHIPTRIIERTTLSLYSRAPWPINSSDRNSSPRRQHHLLRYHRAASIPRETRSLRYIHLLSSCQGRRLPLPHHQQPWTPRFDLLHIRSPLSQAILPRILISPSTRSAQLIYLP